MTASVAPSRFTGKTSPTRLGPSASGVGMAEEEHWGEDSVTCAALLRDLPAISRETRDPTTAGGGSKHLPNLLGRSLVARFQKVSRSAEPVEKCHKARWRTTPAPHVAGTSSWPAKGNVGLYVRYPEECYQFNELPNIDEPTLDRNKDTEHGSPQVEWNNSMLPASAPERLTRNPTQEAIDVARKSRLKSMGDALAGINRDYLTEKPKLKLLFDKKSRRKSRGISFSAPPKKISCVSTKEGRSKTSLRKNIPGRYQFPKESDFITPHHQKLETPGIELNVRPREESSDGRQAKRSTKSEFYMPTKATGPGKLCRNFYPVTEALHRHGTSVTKTKAKPLSKGEWNVQKVWNRPSDLISHPSVMAREDIHLASESGHSSPVVKVA